MASLVAKLYRSIVGRPADADTAASRPAQATIGRTNDGRRLKVLQADDDKRKQALRQFAGSLTSSSTSSLSSDVTIISQEEAKKSRYTRNNAATSSWLKFSIPSFTWPSFSFLKIFKSTATKKQEALDEILKSPDDIEKKKSLITLIKGNSTMTEEVATEQANQLIRKAYGKRAMESFVKEKDNYSMDTNAFSTLIASDLKQAMPDFINDKEKMVTSIIAFLTNPDKSEQEKAILMEKIKTYSWSNEILNNLIQSAGKKSTLPPITIAEAPKSMLPKRIFFAKSEDISTMPDQLKQFEGWDYAGDPNDLGGHVPKDGKSYTLQELKKMVYSQDELTGLGGKLPDVRDDSVT